MGRFRHFYVWWVVLDTFTFDGVVLDTFTFTFDGWFYTLLLLRLIATPPVLSTVLLLFAFILYKIVIIELKIDF